MAKFPYFNVQAEGPGGGYVHGKGGGRFGKPMPKPSNQNAGVLPFKTSSKKTTRKPKGRKA